MVSCKLLFLSYYSKYLQFSRGGGAINDVTFFNKLMAKRISIRASTLRSRPYEYKQTLIESLILDPDVRLLENISNVLFIYVPYGIF